MKNMKELREERKEYIIKLLKEGKELPEKFKYFLFPTKQKEYELVYAEKIRKEDLLANEDGVFPVPLQIDKVFNGERESWDDGWKNMIVFGDNLQFLKTVYENEDPLIKDKVKGKVKLIYIDPPFATESDFKGKEGQKAYRDKTKGAEFVEFLRRRLILAREILADDGFIMVHLDWKKSHYIKLILDEVFGESNFRSEIIWRSSKTSGRVARPKKFDMVTTSIFLYAKKDNSYLNKQKKVVLYTEDECKEKFKWDEKEKKYFKDSPRGNYSDESIEDLEKQNRIYRTSNGTIRIKTFLEEIIVDGKKMFRDFKEIDNIWDDLPTMMHVPKDEKNMIIQHKNLKHY